MQYKVPQNVDLPDRVIANLTLRQFMYIFAAAGIIMILFKTLQGPIRIFFLPISIVAGSAGLAMAFLKINDRPLEVFLLAVAKNFTAPRVRVWQKDKKAEITENEKPTPIEPLQSYNKRSTKKSELQKLASMVDSGLGLVESGRLPSVHQALPPDPEGVQDIITKTEGPSEEIEKIIDDGSKKIKKNSELPVSTMASIQTSPEDFNYERVRVENKDKTNSLIDKVNNNGYYSKG